MSRTAPHNNSFFFFKFYENLTKTVKTACTINLAIWTDITYQPGHIRCLALTFSLWLKLFSDRTASISILLEKKHSVVEPILQLRMQKPSLSTQMLLIRHFFNQKVLIFLIFNENIFCGYSLEGPHWGTSNEYPQHMFHGEIKHYMDMPTHMELCYTMATPQSNSIQSSLFAYAMLVGLP